MKNETEFAQTISDKMRHKKRMSKIAKFVFGFFVGYLLCVLATSLFVSEAVPERDTEPPIEYRELDTDGDGLKDWQEELYQTSKVLRDSDGDGVTDADEVAQGFDPNYYGEGISDELDIQDL